MPTPNCGFCLAEILRLAGGLTEGPQLFRPFDISPREALEIQRWLSRWISNLTGVSASDVWEAARRLANDAELDGHPPGSALEMYAGPLQDFNHVVAHFISWTVTAPRRSSGRSCE